MSSRTIQMAPASVAARWVAGGCTSAAGALRRLVHAEAIGAEAEAQHGGAGVVVAGGQTPGAFGKARGEGAEGEGRAVLAEADQGAGDAALAGEQEKLVGLGHEAGGAGEGGLGWR